MCKLSAFTITILSLAATSSVFASPKLVEVHPVPANFSSPGHVHTNLYTYKALPSGFSPDVIPGPETPATLRGFYNIPTSAQGGDAIAVIDAYDDPKALSDFNFYAAAGGYPVETSTNPTASTNKVFQVVYAEGVKPPLDPNGPDDWDLEECADIQITHGVAPKAKIYLVEAKDNNFNSVYKAFQVATKLPGVRIIGQSFGAPEDSTITPLSYATTGIAIFSASGDSGAGVQYPATSPYNVSVGGTQLVTIGGKFYSEIGYVGSGGGTSAYFSRPSYENNVSGIVGTKRGNPDISADAAIISGIDIYDSLNPKYGWIQVGGTSISCQIVGAFADLSGNHLNSFAENQKIYAALGSSKLRDITSGGIGIHVAKPGYDFVTGVGVPNGLGAL